MARSAVTRYIHETKRQTIIEICAQKVAATSVRSFPHSPMQDLFPSCSAVV